MLLDHADDRIIQADCSLKSRAVLLGVLAICIFIGAWFVTEAGTVLFNTSVVPLAGYYDAQGEALTRGRLDIPCEAIGGEAFIIQGRCYGYFGHTPSLFRIPLNKLFPARKGQWCRISAIAGYAVFLLSAAGLFAATRRFLAGAEALPAWDVCRSLSLLALGLGSTAIFLMSRPPVYHEALIWSGALAVASFCCVMRYLDSGVFRDIALAWLAAILSIHAKPACGLSSVAACALAPLLRSWVLQPAGNILPWIRHTLPRTGFIPAALMAALVFVSYAGVIRAKFSPYQGVPLHLNPMFNEARRAQIDGSLFRLQNMRWQCCTFFGWTQTARQPDFPFVTFQIPDRSRQLAKFPESRIDQIEPYASVTASMTALLLLGLVGLAGSLRTSRTGLAMAAVIACAFSGLLLLFIFTAVSHRYMHEAVLFLAVAASAGAVVVSKWKPVWRKVALAVFAALVIRDCATNVLLTLDYQTRDTNVGGTLPAVKAWVSRVRSVLGETTESGSDNAWGIKPVQLKDFPPVRP